MVTISCTRHEPVDLVQIDGAMDETFDGSSFAQLGPYVAIDMSKVTRISSYGVRQWVQAVSAMKSQYVAYLNVRPMLVSQFNMIRGFAAQGHIISFFAPYACESCEDTFELFIDLREQHSSIAQGEPPPAQCPKCKSEGEFDDLPDSFFSYLKTVSDPKPPSEMTEVINRSKPDSNTTPSGG